MASTIIFWGFKFIIERKLIKFLLSVLLAATFHITVFIMLPVFIGVSYHLTKKCNFNRVLSGSSLFIYIAHLLIGPVLVKMCLMIIPISNLTVLPIYLFAITITIIILVMGYRIIGRLPSFLQVLLLGKCVAIKK